MRYSLGGLVAVIALSTLPTNALRAADFSVNAELVEALENGPVIVKLELTYKGRVPVKVDDATWWPGILSSAAAGSGWKEPEKIPLGGNGGMLRRVLRPGEKVIDLAYIHHAYASIPAGKASLVLYFPMRPVKGHLSTPAHYTLDQRRDMGLSTTLDVQVQTATDDRLAALRQRLEKIIEKPDVSPEAERGVVNTVLWARHPELAPVALRLMRTRGGGHIVLRPFVYELSRKWKGVHGSLIKHLRDYGDKEDWRFFAYWKRNRVQLPKVEILLLLQNTDLWFRARTYAAFPEQCPSTTHKVLLDEAARLSETIRKVPERER